MQSLIICYLILILLISKYIRISKANHKPTNKP